MVVVAAAAATTSKVGVEGGLALSGQRMRDRLREYCTQTQAPRQPPGSSLRPSRVRPTMTTCAVALAVKVSTAA